MKTSKEKIILESLRLFSESGFDAVSTSMIAEKLGITKGALYRHFESKQAILDAIIDKMFALDEEQANANHVPAKEIAADKAAYENTAFCGLCAFVNEQYEFWTENEFACLFRRMITVEQYKNERMRKLYQDAIALGPVKYTEDLCKAMLKNGQLRKLTAEIDPFSLAMELFAPLKLSIALFDGGADSNEIKKSLKSITKDFEDRWIREA